MFLKLAYLPSKLRFSGKYLFQEHQISAGKLSADSSSTETIYCLNSIHVHVAQPIRFLFTLAKLLTTHSIVDRGWSSSVQFC